MKCDICLKEFKNIKSMTNHRRWHKLPEYENFQKGLKKKMSLLNSKENNGMWKENPKIDSLHDWVRYNKEKTGICSDCGKETKTDWSSNTHEYTRDLSEYIERCRSCHMKYDYKMGFRTKKRCKDNSLPKLPS